MGYLTTTITTCDNWNNLKEYEMIFDASLKYGEKRDILKHFKEVNNL